MTTLAGTPMTTSSIITRGAAAVWPLPHTSACAHAARTILRGVLAELAITDHDDCLIMVSELTTNAWLHGLGGRDLDDQHAPPTGRSELAIYRRGPRERPELVITVFDPRPDLNVIPKTDTAPLPQLSDNPLEQPLPPDLLGELLTILPSGQQGLITVRALSAGRTGFYRTRSRLGVRCVSGKAAWFAIPIPATSPAATPPPCRLTPGGAIRKLRDQLAVRGLAGMYLNDQHDRSLLSLRHLTIWSHGDVFTWTDADQKTVRVPHFDLIEAVDQIIHISDQRSLT